MGILGQGWFIGFSGLVVIAGAIVALRQMALEKNPAVLPHWKRCLMNLYFARFSLLILVALALFWTLGEINPRLLRNLFVLDQPLQLLVVTVCTVVVSATALVTAYTTVSCGDRRFGEFRLWQAAQPAGEAVAPVAERAPAAAVRPRWAWLLTVILFALPTPIYCALRTSEDGGCSVLGASVALVLGVLGGLFVLFLATVAQVFLLDKTVCIRYLSPFEKWLEPLGHRFHWLRVPVNALAVLLRHLDPGFTVPHRNDPGQVRSGPPRLRPGHAQNLLLLIVIVGLYSLVYFLKFFLDLAGPHRELANLLFAPLIYALLLLMLLATVLPALAFVLDYYRVPVVGALAVVSLTLSLLCGTDHFYDLHTNSVWQSNWLGKSLIVLTGLAGLAGVVSLFLRPRLFLRWLATFLFFVVLSASLASRGVTGDLRFPDPDRTEAEVDLLRASRTWRMANDRVGRKTLVVVTASGGGIQATAWTAEVLSRLHERYADFTPRVRLISGVSGGSLGTALYLSQWEDLANGEEHVGEETPARRLRTLSRHSGLEASAAGIAFPDFLRLAFPPIVHPTMDRGWALEQEWGRLLEDSREGWGRKSLRELAGPMARGEMPVAVFNAVLAESGQRLTICPLASPPLPREPGGPRDFVELFGDEADLRLCTAVRLSAGFPYVSPLSRAWRESGARRKYPDGSPARDYHVVDGGYVDSEGAFTLIRWLRELLEQFSRFEPRKRGFDRILIVRILPIPAGKPEQPGLFGWGNEFFGPITALQHVRLSSQRERNNVGLASLRHHPAAEGANPIEVEVVQFQFQAPPDATIPLSWKLSRKEQERLEKAWAALETEADEQPWTHTAGPRGNPLAKMDRWLTRRPAR
jgi:hypothetical protein